jgi:hypothetical protein
LGGLLGDSLRIFADPILWHPQHFGFVPPIPKVVMEVGSQNISIKPLIKNSRKPFWVIWIAALQILKALHAFEICTHSGSGKNPPSIQECTLLKTWKSPPGCQECTLSTSKTDSSPPLRVSSLTVFQSVNYKTDFTSLLAID